MQLTWACEEQLFRQEMENADDIRLSVRLFSKCLPDKKKVRQAEGAGGWNGDVSALLMEGWGIGALLELLHGIVRLLLCIPILQLPTCSNQNGIFLSTQ